MYVQSFVVTLTGWATALKNTSSDQRRINVEEDKLLKSNKGITFI